MSMYPYTMWFFEDGSCKIEMVHRGSISGLYRSMHHKVCQRPLMHVWRTGGVVHPYQKKY